MVFLEKCCFCIDLRSGSFIFAYIKLIINLAWLSLLIQGYLGFFLTALGFLGIIIFMLECLNIIFILLLITGLHKNKPAYLLAFLIYNVFNLVYVGVVIRLTHDDWETALYITTITVVQLYFMVVIDSYYQNMESPENTALMNDSKI